MKNIDDVLDAVKAKTGSDYRTAAIVGKERMSVSGWRARRSMPTNKDLLKMVDYSGIDLREAIEAVEYSREHERPMKQAGFADVGLLAGMSLVGVTWAISHNEIMTLGALLLPAIHYAKQDEIRVAANDDQYGPYVITLNYAKA